MSSTTKEWFIIDEPPRGYGALEIKPDDWGSWVELPFVWLAPSEIEGTINQCNWVQTKFGK